MTGEISGINPRKWSVAKYGKCFEEGEKRVWLGIMWGQQQHFGKWVESQSTRDGSDSRCVRNGWDFGIARLVAGTGLLQGSVGYIVTPGTWRGHTYKSVHMHACTHTYVGTCAHMHACTHTHKSGSHTVTSQATLFMIDTVLLCTNLTLIM